LGGGGCRSSCGAFFKAACDETQWLKAERLAAQPVTRRAASRHRPPSARFLLSLWATHALNGSAGTPTSLLDRSLELQFRGVMKQLPCLTLVAGLLAVSAATLRAQPNFAAPDLATALRPGQPESYSVIERGPHHRVMASVTWSTNAAGRAFAHTNLYTELATGMHRLLEGGGWVPSSTRIEVVPGGAIARNGPHVVSFPATIATPVECVTPDGRRLRSIILGLSYLDTSTGDSVLLAELKNSAGQLLPTAPRACVRLPTDRIPLATATLPIPSSLARLPSPTMVPCA
jgi:hypothetical protein